MKKQILQLALNEDGKLVSIYDVPPGKKCKCFYWESGNKKVYLVAKNKGKTPDTILKRNQKTAYFARADGQEINNTAYESVIHWFAKKVLKEEKNITIPPLYSIELDFTLINSQAIQFIEVKIEEFDNCNYTFKPDAIGITKNKESKLFIEFHKTHAVNQDKFEKIKKHGVSCIEIDVNDIPQLSFDGKPNKIGIKERLHDTLFSKWIYNSKETSLLKKKKIEIKEGEKKSRHEYHLKMQQEFDLARKKACEDADEKQLIKNQLKKINEQGYDFKQIFAFPKAYRESNDNENIKYENEYKSLGYRSKNVYCDKEKINTRINPSECENCEYFNTYLHQKQWEGESFIICGFKKGLKNK